ncbi:MAG: hypothetical protein ACI4UM_09195 [Succinivibrio sp.]
MSSFVIILIVIAPVLFVIGVVYNALKEQKKLEQGELKKILESRKADLEKAKQLSEKSKKCR